MFGGVLCLVTPALQAASTSATAYAGATISSSGSVGVVTPPVVVAPVTSVTVNPTTPTATSIRSVPVSTTSNIGYSSPAPVSNAAASASAAAAAAGTSSTESPAATSRAFAASGAAPISLGPSAAVAVAGSPNQTYTVILPGTTAYSSGGEVVSLSNFQHNAGTTPAVGSNGSGVFTIGAKSETSPAAPETAAVPGGGDQQSAAATAFTKKSPLVNIAVTYN